MKPIQCVVSAITAASLLTGATVCADVVRSENFDTDGEPLAAGSIAFVGFNADGDDDLAIVALDAIPANTTIYFTDEEWNGSAFGSGEGDITWNSGAAAIAAGTIITFSQTDSTGNSGYGVSHGSIAGSLALNATDEDVYAYLGAAVRQPATFLAAIANHNGWTLAGTGLVVGQSAIALPNSSDIGAYTGVRDNLTTFAAYAAQVNTLANWTVQGDVSDGHQDGIAPDLPFDATPFTLAGTTPPPAVTILAPEPGSFVEYAISSVALSGTVTNAVGRIVWSNEASSASGVLDASSPWIVASVPLDPGANRLRVTATNLLGVAVATSVTVLRALDIRTDRAGSIAFTAFNSAGDSFAFTLLETLPAATVIRFTDNEWDGIAFNTGETDLVWSNSAAIAAGTVVAVTNCDSGALIGATAGHIASGRLDLSQSGEDIYAYIGEEVRVPSGFLAVISTATGELRGTGLAYGLTAVAIKKSPASQYYSGPRAGEREWSDYLPLINDPANWSATEGSTASWGDTTAFSRSRSATVLLLQ